MEKKNEQQKPMIAKNGERFTGNEACQSCHKNIYDSFLHTAHYHTSEEANRSTIKEGKGKDISGFNYSYIDRVQIERHADSFYQVAYHNGSPGEMYRMDFTIGSGTRGQTYLSMQKNNLFQLPVSYFTSADALANSPGFPSGIPKFNRIIYSRCLECHTTYADHIGQQKDANEKMQLFLGVSCERCHGPGGRHVDYHTQNPGKTKGEFIIDPNTFSRVQRLDLCALCHSGTRQPTKPAFSYMAGDTLSQFFQPVDTTASVNTVDVHVNQYGLLTKSKCFLNSETLSCQTCHNTHKQERGDLALFSQRCMNCHKENDCHFREANPSLSSVFASNCIDCHMPVRDSKILSVQLEGSEKESPAKIRSHFIAVYPEDAKRIINLMNKSSTR